MNSTSYVLQAAGLRKSFGNVLVLKDLSLSLEAGAFACVMGPSGSGKSTFLHLVAGLLTPDAGTVTIAGREISSLPDAEAARFRRRHVGLVFQDFNLVQTLTARENVALPLLLDGATPDDAELDALFDKLGIAARRDALPATLSGGERQRVAIARAWAAHPDVILADEPTGNLDSPAARSFCGLLERMNREEGRTILMVSHDPVIAAFAASVHILKDGCFVDSFATRHDPAFISERYLKTME